VGVLLVALGPLSLFAQPTSPPDSTEDDPLEMRVTFLLLDVRRILDADQSIDADLYYRLQWRDPRLRHDGDRLRWVGLDQIWAPHVTPLFPRGAFSLLPASASVDPEGNVQVTQRLSGEFGAPTYLRDFPFDAHTIRFPFILGNTQGVGLRVEPGETVGVSSSLTIPDWSIGSGELTSERFTLGASIPPVPGFSFQVEAERESGHYLLKVIFPLVVIVMMSWTVFWVPPPQIAVQFGFAATAILSVIAYRFAFTGQLPPVPYSTRLDVFLNGAFVLAFLALVEVIVTARWIYRDRTPFAEAVDRTCRWSFPLLLTLVTLYAFFL